MADMEEVETVREAAACRSRRSRSTETVDTAAKEVTWRRIAERKQPGSRGRAKPVAPRVRGHQEVERGTKGEKGKRVIKGEELRMGEARELGRKLEETRGHAPHVADAAIKQRCVRTSRPPKWAGSRWTRNRNARAAKDMDIMLDTTPRVVGRTQFWRSKTVKW